MEQLVFLLVYHKSKGLKQTSGSLNLSQHAHLLSKEA